MYNRRGAFEPGENDFDDELDSLQHIDMEEEEHDEPFNYDTEYGGSFFKVFDGSGVGRKCKRDTLMYGLIFTSCGIALVVISAEEEQSYYFTTTINSIQGRCFRGKLNHIIVYINAYDKAFSGTRWLVAILNIIHGILYFIALRFWYTLSSNRTAILYYLYTSMMYTFLEFLLAVVSISCFFTVFATVNFSVSRLIAHKYYALCNYNVLYLCYLYTILFYVGSTDASSSDSVIYSYCSVSHT